MNCCSCVLVCLVQEVVNLPLEELWEQCRLGGCEQGPHSSIDGIHAIKERLESWAAHEPVVVVAPFAEAYHQYFMH